VPSEDAPDEDGPPVGPQIETGSVIELETEEEIVRVDAAVEVGRVPPDPI
jgi:hypothetical protein